MHWALTLTLPIRNSDDGSNGEEEPDGDQGEVGIEGLVGKDFELDVDVQQTLTEGYDDDIINKKIHHRYHDGWYRGTVVSRLEPGGSRKSKRLKGYRH